MFVLKFTSSFNTILVVLAKQREDRRTETNKLIPCPSTSLTASNASTAEPCPTIKLQGNNRTLTPTQLAFCGS